MESSAPKHEAIGLVFEEHVALAARESVDHLWVKDRTQPRAFAKGVRGRTQANSFKAQYTHI